MSSTEHDKVAATEESIAQWLMDQLAFYEQIDPETITPDAPLSEMELDSIYVLTLCTEIEDAYDLEVDASIFAEHGTLREVAAELASRAADG
ncbi:acyl carrier protein [uncultured Demequina sp.]|uniref:acyl carrier protein n=1 Tax=uncultured Demequina sp. TaxID=693499 RepID=UPI0025E03AA5|nr:acyl carrier protein [uncultured Demequina sp.]